MSEKITPTVDEVLAALKQEGRGRARPLSAPDIARLIGGARGKPFNDTPGDHVYMGRLDKVLTRMTTDGGLELRRGKAWIGLAPTTYGMAPRGYYFATPAQVRQWEELREQRRSQEAERRAAFWAKEELAGLHAEEFQELMAEYHRREQGVTGEASA